MELMGYKFDINEFRLASIIRAKIANETASSAPHLRRVVLLCTTLDSFIYRTQQAELDSPEERPKDDTNARPDDFDTSKRPAEGRPLTVVNITEIDPDSDSASDSDPDHLCDSDGDSDDDTSISSSSSNNGHGDAEDEFGQEGSEDCDFDPRLTVSFDYDTDSRDRRRQRPGYFAAECPRLSQKSERDTHCNGVLTSGETIHIEDCDQSTLDRGAMSAVCLSGTGRLLTAETPRLQSASVYNRS